MATRQRSLTKNGSKPIRLSWCMVVRNCAKNLDAQLRVLRPYVDQLIIGLGGASDDRTEAIVRKYADVVVDCADCFPPNPYDWSTARNRLMPFVVGDYFAWSDGDDQIDHPERLADILRAMDSGIDRVDLVYDYAFDDHGNLLTAHQRERIMRTSKEWHWLDRVHETCNTDRPHKAAFDDTVKVIHKRSGKDNASERNLPILLEMMEADPKPRTLIHLAHAYYSLGKWEEAIFYYEQYSEQPENDLNKWSAQIMAARCAVELDDWHRTQLWAMSAAALLPQYQDAYVLLANATWHSEQDVPKTEAWMRAAKSAEEAPLQVFRMPLDNLSALWDIEHRVLAGKRKWAEALAICEEAHDRLPDSKQWTAMCQFYRECVFTERSRASALQLADHMIRHGDVVRAKSLLENFLPSTVRDDPAILGAQMRVRSMLNSNAPEDYEDADHFYDDWDAEKFPRFQWYVERLQANGCRKVLEVGCHNGLMSRKLAALGFECVGVDFNQKVIDIANERRVEGTRFICGRLEDINETFDAVLFAEVLEHVTPTEQMKMLNQAEALAPLVMGSVPAEPIGLCAGLFEKSDIGVETFRPHIFEFDQTDMETLILTDPDRRIVNCHKLLHKDHPIPGYANRVFEFVRQPHREGMGIAFMLGPGFEEWNPRDIDGKGIGGSETAAVRLAEELSSRGHFVTVYATEQGVYNGVVYRNWKAFDPTEEREVVIVSRELTPLQERPNAALVYLWCHDIAYEDGDFTEEIADRLDGVVLLSDWQKGYWADRYPWLDKTTAIGNAITPYEVNVERIPHRFVYSSSPDRGLDDLLFRFPLIREMWPDAELHIFYGWQYLDHAPHLGPFKQHIINQLKQPGVFWHGRVGQKELAEEFSKAQFWLYPSLLPRQPNQNTNGADFHETFCISALEAEMYGCIPVTRSVGALPERLNIEGGELILLEDWTTKNILKTLDWFSRKDGDAALLRENMRENAEQYTWQSVADKWLTLIAANLMEKFGELVEA